MEQVKLGGTCNDAVKVKLMNLACRIHEGLAQSSNNRRHSPPPPPPPISRGYGSEYWFFHYLSLIFLQASGTAFLNYELRTGGLLI
jgi:hypothetical protein